MTRSRRAGALALAVALSLLLAVTTVPASAQTAPGEATGGGSSGGDGAGGGSVTAGVTVGESLPGHAGGGPGTNGGTTRTGEVALVTTYWRGPLPGFGCQGVGAEVPGAVAPDDRYEQVRHDRSVEPPEITVLQTTCFRPDAPPPVEPPPPDPPTMAEITAIAQEMVIAPSVGVSPPGDGLTGLETWFWYDGATAVQVRTEVVRGYQVVATMAPTRFHWETGETDRPGHLLSSGVPGSAAAPAARWTYETKGTYRLYVQAVWEGTWTFTGWGASASGTLATIRATGARDYVVNEVRSVLTG